jgi:uncharacterized delta-60 repeat protein
MNTNRFFLLILQFCFSFSCFAQDGVPDISFSQDGQATFTFSNEERAYTGLVLPSGKIMAGGYSLQGTKRDGMLTRINEDGTLDTTFANSGFKIQSIRSSANDQILDMVRQPNGKVVVCGFSGGLLDTALFVARFNAGGSLDNTFGTGGIFQYNTNGRSNRGQVLYLQPDGMILVGGISTANQDNDLLLIRLDTAGVPDAGFANQGYFIANTVAGDEAVNGIAMQSSGKIILSINTPQLNFITGRLTVNGQLDSSYGAGGWATYTFSSNNCRATCVLVQSDDKVVAGGINYEPATFNDFALVRFDIDGALDASFGTGGALSLNIVSSPGNSIDYVFSLAQQSDGKIIASGYSSWSGSGNVAFSAMRIEVNGSPDVSFGSSGVITSLFSGSLAYSRASYITSGNKLVLIGEANAFPTGAKKVGVARYLLSNPAGLNSPPAEITNVDVYPNPVRDGFTLRFELMEKQSMDAGLYTKEGKLVQLFFTMASRSAGSYTETFTLQKGISSGTYLVQLRTETGILTKKLVVE